MVLKPSVIDQTSRRISRSTQSFLSDSSTRVSSGETTQMSEYRARMRSSISPFELRFDVSEIMLGLSRSGAAAALGEVTEPAQRALRVLGGADECLDRLLNDTEAIRITSPDVGELVFDEIQVV